ncbi:MAG: CNNM domain-containing protein [Candidatus Omnitrophota bacterium]
MTILIELILILLMLVVTGIFAAYEMALASISLARVHVLVARKVKGAEEAHFMKNNMEASLAVIQLGIALASAIAAATGGLSMADMLSPVFADKLHLPKAGADVLALVCFVLPLSAVTTIFAELVPKMIALNNRERVCMQLSPAMKTLFFLMHPVVRLFERIVKWIIASMGWGKNARNFDDDPGLHELQAAAALARTARLIGSHQEKILIAAAQLSSRQVREISLPLQDVSMIGAGSSLSQALVRAHMDMHTRFPVLETEGDLQSVIGYVNFKDIIAALKINPNDPSIRGIIRPIKAVSADTSISQALEMMIKEKLHIMLVSGKPDPARAPGFLGQSGRLVAMVALEDIIEELVGEIEDEFDRLPAHIHAFAGGWIVGGGVLMSAIAQQVGAAYSGALDGKFADWCAAHGLDESKGGEVLEADGLRVVARKFRRKKVSEATVAVLAASAGEGVHG